jgi:hypothetical protein
MKLTVHIAAVQGAGTSTGWENGRSLTLDRGLAGGRSGEGVSAVELLCLAAGTGYADELLQEAARRHLRVERAHVTVEADTRAGGKTRSIAIAVRAEAAADEPTIMDLVEHTDRVCDVLTVLRVGTPVRLADVELLARR